MHCCRYSLIVGEISNCSYLNRDTLTNQWSLFLQKDPVSKKLHDEKAASHLIVLVRSCMTFKSHMGKCLLNKENEATLLVCWGFCVFSPDPDL